VTALPTRLLADKKTRYIPSVKSALPTGYKCKQTFDYAPKADELQLDPNTGIFTLYHVNPLEFEFKSYDVVVTVKNSHVDSAGLDINP
jgi:hypothetical protein